MNEFLKYFIEAVKQTYRSIIVYSILALNGLAYRVV